jgi:hypothetical protein
MTAPKGTPPCVEVNECAVFATASGAAWWVMYRNRFEGTGRIVTLVASLGGERVAVACDSDDDAHWLERHMREQGLPASALTVRRTTRRRAASARESR